MPRLTPAQVVGRGWTPLGQGLVSEQKFGRDYRFCGTAFTSLFTDHAKMIPGAEKKKY